MNEKEGVQKKNGVTLGSVKKPKRAKKKKTTEEKILDLICKKYYRPEEFEKMLEHYNTQEHCYTRPRKLKQHGYSDDDIQKLEKFTSVLCEACNGNKYKMKNLYEFTFYRLIKNQIKDSELFSNLNYSSEDLNLNGHELEVLFSDKNKPIIEEYYKTILQDIIKNAQDAIKTYQEKNGNIARDAAVTTVSLATILRIFGGSIQPPTKSDENSVTEIKNNTEDVIDSETTEQENDIRNSIEIDDTSDNTTSKENTDDTESVTTSENEDEIVTTNDTESVTTSENEDEIVATNDTEGITLAETDEDLQVMDISYAQRGLCPSGEALINYIEDPEKVAIPPDMLWIRSGYRGYSKGNIVVDDMFWEYADACNEAGYKFAIYFFSQAINEKEAKEEAEWVSNLIQEGIEEHNWGESFTGIIALDIEEITKDGVKVNRNEKVLTTYDSEGKANIVSDVAQPWVDYINDAGYIPVIYSYAEMIKSTGLNSVEDCYFWVAQWNYEQELKCTIPEGKLLGWQKSEGNHFNESNGNVIQAFDWSTVYNDVFEDAIATMTATTYKEEYAATYEDDTER